MTLKELKPEFWEEAGIGEITFECPVCRQRIGTKYSRVASGVNQQGCRVWKASGEINAGNFTLEPSIQQHSIARNWKPCDAHFSVSGGNIVMA